MDLRNTPMSRVSKADMAKTLKIRFSMIETNPLNHKWLDFVILMGLALHQFKKNGCNIVNVIYSKKATII